MPTKSDKHLERMTREMWRQQYGFQDRVASLKNLVGRHDIYLHEVFEQGIHTMNVGDSVSVTRHCKACTVTRVC